MHDAGTDRAMQKCSMCAERIDAGEEPACVSGCPTGALSFGTIESVVQSGQASVDQLVGSGSPDAYLYGEQELGGVGVLSVLSSTPEVYGLPKLPLK